MFFCFYNVYHYENYLLCAQRSPLWEIYHINIYSVLRICVKWTSLLLLWTTKLVFPLPRMLSCGTECIQYVHASYSFLTVSFLSHQQPFLLCYCLIVYNIQLMYVVLFTNSIPIPACLVTLHENSFPDWRYVALIDPSKKQCDSYSRKHLFWF